MRATRTFTDRNGVTHRNGEEWLIKMEDTEAHIPDVYEEVVGVTNITTLTNRQYCVILDPVGSDGKPQLGQRKLVKGEKSFFLEPGERLEKGIQNVYVLGEDEGLIMKAIEEHTDPDTGASRQPGDRWMIRGPQEYVPSVEVEVVTKQKAIPLDENEGIYARDIKTGKVRSVCGSTYMLTQDEELWEKHLPPAVEDLLSQAKDPSLTAPIDLGQQSLQRETKRGSSPSESRTTPPCRSTTTNRRRHVSCSGPTSSCWSRTSSSLSCLSPAGNPRSPMSSRPSASSWGPTSVPTSSPLRPRTTPDSLCNCPTTGILRWQTRGARRRRPRFSRCQTLSVTPAKPLPLGSEELWLGSSLTTFTRTRQRSFVPLFLV
ncbi:Major vault protein [Geodia barretti]|nr:Major vault protein [Geodia barretti]